MAHTRYAQDCPSYSLCAKLYQYQYQSLSSSERISSRVGQTRTFSVPEIQRLTKPPSVRSVRLPPPLPHHLKAKTDAVYETFSFSPEPKVILSGYELGP